MPPVFSYQSLYRAYEDCRKNKRSSTEAIRFEMNAEENIYHLSKRLSDRSYRPSSYSCFISHNPKLREIFAAPFQDRIVHHLLVRYLEKIWEPIFVFDNYASRPGKGIHSAVKRLQRFCRQATMGGKKTAFFLQLDIRNFFMTIDKKRLFAMVATRCPSQDMCWLAHTLIFNDPTENCRLESPEALLAAVPMHKSLFFSGPGRGLPIGNLTSQFFANVYLNGLDQFIKHELKCRHYLRYVDDFVLVHRESHQLESWMSAIGNYLETVLGISLHSRRILRPVTNGIDFLGYIVRPRYLLVRNRVVNNLKSRLNRYESELISATNRYQMVLFNLEILEKLFATLNAYFAHFTHAHCYRLQESIFRRFFFLNEYFSFTGGKIVRKYIPSEKFRSLKRQYYYFLNRYPKSLIFFQVGCFFEFYGSQVKDAQHILNLKKIKGKFGFLQRCGFGKKALHRYIQVSLAHEVDMVVVKQTRYVAHGLAQRLVAVRYRPLGDQGVEQRGYLFDGRQTIEGEQERDCSRCLK